MTGPTVWIIWKSEGDEGAEAEPWHATTELREAADVLQNVDDGDLQAYWWTIREHPVDAPVIGPPPRSRR
jgi:hypothetical protein